MFLQSIFFYFYYCYKIYNNVHRKKLYFNKISYSFILSSFFSFQFIIWYYILVFNEQPIVFLNIASLISMLEPFVYYHLIKKHKKVIKYMNEEENVEEILSYEENPLHGHENILDEMELTNIVI